MNNLPLQPIEWREYGNINGTSFDAITPICEYDIYLSNNEPSYIVAYYNRHTEAPTKEATGFATIDEAKTWAWNHYNEKMQPYLKPSIGTHFNNFTQWSYDRQIIQNGNVLAQGLKLVSEVGELADNLAKGRDIKDDIGDCMVVLNNLVHMTGVTLDGCLSQAWGDIKDRKGMMNEHGVFIKEGDYE